METGSIATWANAIILAIGFKRFCSNASLLLKITAAAPSFIPDALPGVTVPVFITNKHFDRCLQNIKNLA